MQTQAPDANLQTLPKSICGDQIHASELESHASELESHASELESYASELESHASELESYASELESHAWWHNYDASELRSHLSELESRTSELESYDSKLENRTSELRSHTSKLESRTSELESHAWWHKYDASELRSHASWHKSQASELRSHARQLKDHARELKSQEAESLEVRAVSLQRLKEKRVQNVSNHHLKIKEGLSGFLNGQNVSALADTGSRKNVISATYAESLGLKITGSPCEFELGNSRKARSIGIVSVKWAFFENRKEAIPIVCHVLPNCIYDLILGNGFLTATQTLSKYRHRLTQCLFSVYNSFARSGFLSESSQRLRGTLADAYDVIAIPDTGAERNVIDMDYALKMGLKVRKSGEYSEYLQFADGTYEKTEGCVDTYWTFASGERIKVTFAVLRSCCSDIILGEDFLSEHNVFEEHASSLTAVPYIAESYELAPFDFIRTWQRPFEKLRSKLSPKQGKPKANNDGGETAGDPMSRRDAHAEEQRRIDMWNYRYDFGATANTEEKELERLRRARYASGQANIVGHQGGTASTQPNSPEASASHRRMPIVPSIPTAQPRRTV
ncbi:MAG: hypothetical protein Q9201_000527 [Fulgogasparrea decipioides]